MTYESHCTLDWIEILKIIRAFLNVAILLFFLVRKYCNIVVLSILIDPINAIWNSSILIHFIHYAYHISLLVYLSFWAGVASCGTYS